MPEKLDNVLENSKIEEGVIIYIVFDETRTFSNKEILDIYNLKYDIDDNDRIYCEINYYDLQDAYDPSHHRDMSLTDYLDYITDYDIDENDYDNYILYFNKNWLIKVINDYENDDIRYYLRNLESIDNLFLAFLSI